MNRFFSSCVTGLVCVLALGAAGCETMSSPSLESPRIVKIQGGSADFRKIRGYVEGALKAGRDGDRDGFLSGMEKARQAAVKFLNPASRYRLSDETVYQFLADRLRDEPVCAEVPSAGELASLEARLRGKGTSGAGMGAGAANGVVLDCAGGSLINPDAMKPVLEAMLSEWGETAFAVDDTLARHVSYFVKFYALCDTEKTNRALERSRRYLPHIREVFAKYDLHEDIAFAVPFVESRFTTSACSSAGAVGMFQFLAGTARDYGLRVVCGGVENGGGPEVDDRLDWEKTSVAAARYLVRSRNVFASNVLALGAYHHGSDTVVKVLLAVAEKSRERSFDAIFSHKELGPYSREYIPQCLAAAYLYRLMKGADVERLPTVGVSYENLAGAVAVKSLSSRYADLFVNNPDLLHADQTYSYANTGGYRLVTRVRNPDASLAALRVDDRSREGGLKEGARKKEAEKAAVSREEGPTPAGDGGLAGPSAGAADEGGEGGIPDHAPPCMLAYTFQKENSLEKLSRVFGVSMRTILDHPANHRLKEKYPAQPKPGETVFIPGLAPTTVILSSADSSSGRERFYYTEENQSLNEIAESLVEACRSLEDVEAWAAITAADIIAWNRDRLPREVRAEDPLPGGIPLFIAGAFR